MTWNSEDGNSRKEKDCHRSEMTTQSKHPLPEADHPMGPPCSEKTGDCSKSHCLICDRHSYARFGEKWCSHPCFERWHLITRTCGSWDGVYRVNAGNEQVAETLYEKGDQQEALANIVEFRRQHGRFDNFPDRQGQELNAWLSLKLDQLARGEYELLELRSGEHYIQVRR